VSQLANSRGIRGLASLARDLGVSRALVLHALQQLEANGQVLRIGSRWSLAGSGMEHRPPKGLGGERGSEVPRPEGWDAVRALCTYYAECLEAEAGGKAELEVGDATVEVVELSDRIDWGRLASGEPVTLPAGDAHFELVRASDRNRVRIAGPIELVKGRGDRPDQLLPVFLLPVVARRGSRDLELVADGEPRLNEAWVESRFGRANGSRREETLVRLGMYREVVDSQSGGMRLEPRTGLRIDELWSALIEMDAERIREGGDAIRPATRPPWTQLRAAGSYQRLMLLPAVSSKFTQGTMNELREIARAPDDLLEGTALRALFASLLKDMPQPRRPRRTVLPEFRPLNREQRSVVELAAWSPLLAVQGPPGTGKSLTVMHVLASQALRGRSALFASKNHRALEAVVPRMQAIDEDHPLIFRLTRNAGNATGEGENWIQAILDLARVPVPDGALQQKEETQAELARALELRQVVEDNLGTASELAGRLGEATAQRGRIEAMLDPRWLQRARSAFEDTSRGTWKRLERVSAGAATATGLRGWMARKRVELGLRWLLSQVKRDGLQLPDGPDVRSNLLAHIARWADLDETSTALEERVLPQAVRADLSERLQSADSEVQACTQRALRALCRAQVASLTDEIRMQVANLRGEIGRKNVSNKIHQQKHHVRAAISQVFLAALDIVPLWACSNLSVRSRMPLLAGAFDLVVIDEASQCDIASCIPLLYRARRAMVVGDPQQLTHSAKVSRQVEDRIRDGLGLRDESFGSFLHTSNSIWDPAAAHARGAGGETLMLREHWRCHPAIAEYVSNLFYAGELLVRTAVESNRSVVRGGKILRGIEWTHVDGGSESHGSSRSWAPQVEAIVEELVRLAESGFEGTVGVVTPFRLHADRVRNAVAERLPAEVLKGWNFESQTADGFQGDERDVILFGLVGGPDPAQVPGFYKTDRNRFNVAVSRARGLLHVFGDQRWAEACGLETLVALVRAWRVHQERCRHQVRKELIGPVWEPKLADAMRQAGIEFHQQFSACGFYLDFAILKPGLKLAVEVDGETYHRDSKGNLRVEDVRRDQLLRAAGWQVKRFWVYELRDDIHACVQHIRDLLASA